MLAQRLRPHTLYSETCARSQAGQILLFFLLLINSALEWDKAKNKTNLTELPILAQRLRLHSTTRTRTPSGPNFFVFSFIN
jgi:hypothetical protein